MIFGQMVVYCIPLLLDRENRLRYFSIPTSMESQVNVPRALVEKFSKTFLRLELNR